MQKELSGDGDRAVAANPAPDERVETSLGERHADVEGFFDVVRLGPPVCLPVLPRVPRPRSEIEPLGDPRGRELLP
jgi:hypothetical protein